jgi:hypothetical protein
VGEKITTQAGLAAVGVEPGLQVTDPVQVGQGHPGRGRDRREDIQPAGHQQKHQQADGQESKRTPPSPSRRCGGCGQWSRIGHNWEWAFWSVGPAGIGGALLRTELRVLVAGQVGIPIPDDAHEPDTAGNSPSAHQ